MKVGDKIGKLTIIANAEKSKDKHLMFLCKCECGNEQIVRKSHLKTGKITQCKKCSAKGVNKKHGLKGTESYNAWLRIKSRCYNEKNISYKYYGGRGITVCEEWRNSPEAFDKWYKENKKDNCTIDRIDTNKGYSPDNCRFSTIKEQGRNKRNNVLVEYNDEIITASECAEIVGISNGAMIQRIHRHPNDERIFNKQWIGDKKNQYTITTLSKEQKNGEK